MELNRKRHMTFELTTREIKFPRLYNNDSDNESVHSLQQHDTDPAKDTSDTSDDSEMTEYEVAHMPPDVPNPFFSTDDSDEINEINEIAELGAVVAAVSANLSDIDVGQLADTSTEPSSSPTSNSDVDPELPRLDFLDFWTCAQCKAQNENRHVPFCTACYRMRKTFFPPRPRKRKVKLLKLSSLDQACGALTSVSSKDTDVVDGPIQSITRQDSLASVSGTSKSSESGIEVTNSNDFDVVDGPVAGSSSSSNSLAENKDSCQICLVKVADGLFYHGRSAHRFACYHCAKLTWRKLGHCPLCRRKIIKVLKLR